MHSASASPRRLAAALLAGLAMLIFPPSASALTKGLNTDMTWGISGAEQDQTMAGLSDLGAGWQRLVVAWHDIERRDNSYSELSAYDQAINKAEVAGINLVVTVYTAPGWASGVSNRESPPQDPADYADFLTFAANRWGSQVDAWEIWNEQNAQGFWSTGPDPAHYARLLRAAYPAVKAADPTAQVVYGGTWENDYDFLEAAYAEVPNLGDYFDVMGTHPYNGVSSPESVSLRPDGRIEPWSFAGYRELRATMLAHGDDKPIWFTEFGWSTFNDPWGVSEATQAEYLTKALECAEQDSYVQAALWYAYRNHPYGDDGHNWEYQLGLARTDFSPKPAYDAFKSYTSGSGECTYQYPGGAAPEPTPQPEVVEPTPVPEDEPQSSTVTASGGPVLRVRFVRTQRARAAVVGRVKRADRGRVVIRMQRRSENRSWRHARSFRLGLNERGRFHKRLKLGDGRWRLRAVYRVGSSKKTRSRLVYFRG